jgi:hypothetical protein
LIRDRVPPNFRSGVCVDLRSGSRTKAPPKAAPHKTCKPEMTAEALEHLIAERFGVRPVQVTVRGHAPDWTATLITNRLGNSERLAAFSSLVSDLRVDYDLKPG